MRWPYTGGSAALPGPGPLAVTMMVAGWGAVAWVTGKMLGFLDISMHRDPASMVIFLAFTTLALALVTRAGRNRSIVLAALVSVAVTAGALAVGYNDCYGSFRETIYRNVHNGVMAGIIDTGDRGRSEEVVGAWQGLSRDELSREFIRFRLGTDHGGGFADYMRLVSGDDFVRTRGAAPAGGGGDQPAWKAQAGQFLLTFALSVLGILPPTVLTRLRELEKRPGGYSLPGISMADIWTAMPAAMPGRTGGKAERHGRG